MSFSDAQETLIAEHSFGVAVTVPNIATHLALCTGDPEAGANISTATRQPIAFVSAGSQVSGRHRVQNSGTVTFTNDSGGSLTVTHLAAMTALTAGSVVAGFALPSSIVVPNGASLQYTAGEITFDVG